MAEKRIVILGGGTGGTTVANRLRRRFDLTAAQIDVGDQDDWQVYEPGLLFVPFGMTEMHELVRPRYQQLARDVAFHEGEIEAVELDRHLVALADGRFLPYDVLVVATGGRLQPEETEGLLGPGWNARVFTFST